MTSRNSLGDCVEEVHQAIKPEGKRGCSWSIPPWVDRGAHHDLVSIADEAVVEFVYIKEETDRRLRKSAATE